MEFWEYVEHGLHGELGWELNGVVEHCAITLGLLQTDNRLEDEMSPVIGEHPHTRPQLTPKAALVQVVPPLC